MDMSSFSLVFLLVFISLIPVSILVEKLRPAPVKPDELYWDKNIIPQYIDIEGNNIRYIKCGEGPALLLLHTLRTQLDIFQKMIPHLAENFTVYAMDYPGHGWSDIPQADYSAKFFVNAVDKFMHKLDLQDVTVAGVSIGASIPLISAGRGNTRIKRVISINPYDYPGKGAARGNLVARLLFNIMYIPVIGDTFMRLRIRLIEKMIMIGGVFDKYSLPAEFLEQMFVVGERPGHLQAFIKLVRNSASFAEAHNEYKNISVPVKIIYGEKDWATEDERQATQNAIPGATLVTIKESGHFLALEKPEQLNEIIRDFSRRAEPVSMTKS